jgi:hypothetical protein
VQIEAGAIQLLIQSAKGGFYPRSKRPKRKADISSSTEVKKLVELYLNYRICFYGVRRDNFTLLGGAARLGKGKAIPLQPLTGPKGSWKLRHPDFKTIGT